MAARSQTTNQNRIRTGSFRRCGLLVANEVAIEGAKTTTHYAASKSPLVGSNSTTRRTQSNSKDSSSSSLSSSTRTILPDRCTRLAAAPVSPILAASHRRNDEWNERLDPERRNRPDTNDRRPFVTKTTTMRRSAGPTNLIAVTTTQTLTTLTTCSNSSSSSLSGSSSRIPRFNAITQHRVAAKVGPTRDSSGTMDSSNDSSLDLSRIGRNRSTNSSQSSTSSLVAKPSRLLPPGSIVSAKLAAHQVGRLRVTPSSQNNNNRVSTAAIKSKLPVATTTTTTTTVINNNNNNNNNNNIRSTRSLPDSSVRTKVVSTSSQRLAPQSTTNNRMKTVRSSASMVSTSKSVQQRPVSHKTPGITTSSGRGSVSLTKRNLLTAGGSKKKEETENERRVDQEEEGGSECRTAPGHNDGGETYCCWGSQGRLYLPAPTEEGSLSDPIVTPPPPGPLLELDLPGQVDHPHHHHLGIVGNPTDDSVSLLRQSAKSEETTSTTTSATQLSSFNHFHSETVQHRQEKEEDQHFVIQCEKTETMARPVSVYQSSTTTTDEWTVRISIPAAESNEMLTRLECERRSIRGSTTNNYSTPVADVELMELLERDLLLSSSNQKQTTSADESLDNPQRSLSLPKSFLATKYGLIGFKAALPSVRFPWRRAEGNRVTTSQTTASSHHQQVETCSNAAHTSLPPAGPAGSTSTLTAAARRPPGSASTTRTARRFKSTSSPVFIDDDDRVNRSHSAWDLASRPWSHFGEMSVSGSQSHLVETSSVTSITEIHHTEIRESTASPTSNSSTLRKFRKSFSLRLSRRPSQDDTNNEEDQDGDSAEQTSPKFRFGPLVWRASRERNNKAKGAANKAARNAKCNSGDSGVQMESTSQTMDETEASSVRRTQSDLGGEAVIAAALRSTHHQTWSQASAGIPEAAKNRSRKLTRSLAKAHLRRSASQPVVVLPGGIRPDGPSDEDAGLCLSEDDNLSDCGNIPQAENEAVRYSAATEGVLAIALWDHNAVEAEELSLQSGDVVHILDLSDPNWWWAARGQQYGWLPASYVQLCEQPFHRKQGLAQGQKFARTLTPAGIAALQHSVRANVINELVTAERDYVKLLSDLVDGYLKPMKSRPDLFTPQRIQSIFGNLEELYRFQKSFLVDLEHSLNWNALEDSVVGGCFLQHIQEFAIYATYCNNQDRAAAEMQLLCDDIRYLRFFEACRLLRRMIRLPLEAFLLSPVQKICKYPLQLAELLKHTPDEHPDRRLVSLALDSMRSVAYLVNESKRRAEMQQFLVQWQSGVDHWMGSDITTFNSRLVHQGELFKISSNGWTREVTLFLFDKELVICKKELIKRSSLVYKDRLTVEDIEVLEPLTVVDVRPHSFQMRSFSRAKAYLLACRSAQDKNQWIAAIQHLQHHSSEWPVFPAPSNTMTFGRQKMSNKRSKVKQNPALILTLEEAHLTLEGRDLPTKKKS